VKVGTSARPNFRKVCIAHTPHTTRYKGLQYTPPRYILQYMAKAFSVRIDDELLASAKAAAALAGESFSAYVSGALRLRMNGARSIIEAPMSEDAVSRGTHGLEPLRGGTVRDKPKANPVSPMPPEVKAAARPRYQVDPAECRHAFRDRSQKCYACGDQR
jgi:hypothetical protein